MKYTVFIAATWPLFMMLVLIKKRQDAYQIAVLTGIWLNLWLIVTWLMYEFPRWIMALAGVSV